MAGLGTIETFDPTNADAWDSYKERLEFFLLANDVTADDADKQRAVFLSVCGKETYALLKSLIAPALPSSKTFQELLTELSNHFKPTTSEISNTVKFFQRSQRSGEGVSAYLAELRRLAVDCNFGENLSRQLRDRFVSGLADEACQRRLLTESTLTLESALERARASEAAAVHQMEIKGKFAEANFTKNDRKQTPINRKLAGEKFQKYQDRPGNSACHGCGGSHRRSECRFREAECRNCGLKGHIARVCRRSKNDKMLAQRAVKEVSKKSDESSIYSTKVRSSEVNYTGKEKICVQINGKNCVMEVDSGSEYSIISESTFNSLFVSKPKLHRNLVRLQDFQKREIVLLGSCEVTVSFKGHKAKLWLLVAKGKRTSLFGYSWFKPLGIEIVGIHSINNFNSIEALVQEFEEVFQSDLGLCSSHPINLHVDPTVTPIRMKPRRVPYALKPKIDEELDRLIRQGVLEPIANPKWSTPIVPVPKPDGSVRLCADYKVTLNPALQGYAYPIPGITDRLAELAGGKVYAKIDLASAYLQLPVDDSSAEAQTIITHRGAFKANRLQFGIKTAPGIFQEFMEHLLAGIEGVFPYFDDILIRASSVDQLTRRMRQVLQRLKEKNLRAKKEKCVFGATKVEYLGYVIEESGIRPTTSLVKAIKEAPIPQNVSQLQAFLGLLNFYHNFLPNKATQLEPLHKLLAKNSKWIWEKSQDQAFACAKEMLSSESLLTHFDPSKPITLTCDASPYGLGCVLSHVFPDNVEVPIAFHSRSFTSTERNYAQIDREAAAIIAGVKKFNNYLFGQKFRIYTDHKPLLGLLSSSKETPAILSPRMLRWCQLLNAYDYELIYKPGESIKNADGLSRLPLPQEEFEVPPLVEVSFLEDLPGAPLSADDISKLTAKDPVLSQILLWVRKGWPSNQNSADLKPYFIRQHELSTHKGCILWGTRVVIPPKGREKVMQELHLSHPGIVKMKALARSHVWWPGIDEDIEKFVRLCSPCQMSRHSRPAAPVHPWEVPHAPWSRLHLDFAGPVQGNTFLILVDAYSKWLEVVHMTSTTTKALIKVLRRIFATHGIPDSIVSDNQTTFTSMELKEFAERNQIRLIRVAPYHPSSNGQAERMVQTSKEALKKMSGSDLNQKIASFVLRQHITPITSISGSQSPAEMLMGRRLRTCLDRLHPDYCVTRQNDIDSKSQCRKPRSFQPGADVFVKSFQRDVPWSTGRVESATGPLSYKVRLSEGELVRRHVDQMRCRDVIPSSDVPEVPSPVPVEEVLPESSVPQPEELGDSTQVLENPESTPVLEHSPVKLRRSTRTRKKPDYYGIDKQDDS